MGKLDKQIGDAFDSLFLKSNEHTMEIGRLGFPNAVGGYTIDVPGRAREKYVSRGINGEDGVITAIDKIGVANTGWQQVRIRREYGRNVIREAEQLDASGGGGIITGAAPSPHALNSAHHTGTLADAQGPQFLLVDGTRGLAGDMLVASGKTIDGVDISEFKLAYDIHVLDPDAHHARATAGNGLSITGQQLSVNQGYSFSWTGTHSFDQDIQLNADLDFIGAQQITTSAGHLTLNPFADLILPSTKTDRSFDYADGIPIAGFSSHINSGGNRQLTIHTIKADELHVRIFIADGVRIDIGEEYWGPSMGILYENFTTPASIGGTVTVKFEDSVAFSGALFANNDWLLIQSIDVGVGLDVSQIWGQVSGYTALAADINGITSQSWTFTLRNGPTSQVIKKGARAVSFGSSGQGYVHLSTLQSADGPWIQIGTWAGANPYTPGNRTIRTQIGNLSPISDPVLSPTGFGLYSENAYLQGIVSAASDVVRLDSDGVRIKGEPSAFDALYSYEFRNDSDVELGGLYLKYQNTGGSDRASSVYVRSIGTNHIRPFAGMVAESIGSGPAGGDALVFLQAANLSNSKAANITLDADNTTGTIIFGASDYAQFNALLKTVNVYPQVDVTYNLGSASFRYNTLYVNTIVASGGISGGTIGGAEWEYAGSMVIDANSASDTTVSIANQGAGRANLDVDQNITVGGTVDGIDISAHAANPSAHHALASAGDGIGVSGQVISVDGTVVRTTRTIGVSGAIGGGGTLAADRTISLTLATNSGLNQTSGLAVGQGDGISVSGATVAVDGTVVRTPATVVRTTRQVISGGGLTGGGDLSADRTLAVGAGSGITVNADDVAVDATVVRTTRSIVSGGGLTGGGDLSADRTLAIGAGTGITVNADDIAVNQAFTPTWSGAHIFSSGVTLNGAVTLNNDLSITGIRNITTNSTNNLTIAPGGDLVLSPTGLNVLPTGSYAVDLGDYNRKWRTLYVAELYAETLVSQYVMATIGGRIMVTPSTTLVADLGSAVGDTTIHLKHNAYVNGTYIMLETAPGGVPQFEVMKITSSASGSAGDYTYTVTRNADGTGRNAWSTGDSVVSFAGAAAGDGYIDLTSTTTAMSHIGPTITVYARTAATNWNDVKPVVTMGNLDSFLSYGTEYGFAVGNDLTLSPSTGFSGLSADRTNGMRLFNTNVQFYVGGSVGAILNASAGLAFKAGAFSTTSIGWWDHVDVPGDFTDTYRYASMGHAFNGARSVLFLGAQGLSGTYTQGVVNISASGYPSGFMSIRLEPTSVDITTSSTYGTYNIARLTATGLGVGGASPVSVGHFYQNNSATDQTAGITIEQGSTGDPLLHFVADGRRYVIGIDNSDSNKLKIATTTGSSFLGAADVLTITTGGLIGLGAGATAPIYSAQLTPASGNDSAFGVTINAADTTKYAGLFADTTAGYSQIASFGSAASGTAFGQNQADAGVWVTNGLTRLLLGTLDSAPIYVGTAGVERIRVDAAGPITMSNTVAVAALAASMQLDVFSIATGGNNANGGVAPKESVFQNYILTTSATPAVAHTLTLSNQVTTMVRYYVVARRASGSAGAAEDGAGYTVQALFKCSGGTASLIGTALTQVVGESQAGWDCTVVASGNAAQLVVTGATNNNIGWNVTGHWWWVNV